MLTRCNSTSVTERDACVLVGDASFPSPFPSGLEYAAPARGTWNIVHTGMLIPEIHEIFVCAAGCLRGVVLTAAEMNASHRFSTIAVRENNVLEGDMESLMIDGVADILQKLPARPPAVLLYTSCIHHFIGCDLNFVYQTLREKFPDVAFADCYMNPILRKSGLTPDQLMRRQLYSLLLPREINPKSVNIIGNNLPTDETSELVQMLRTGGFTLRDITRCSTYADYQKMAESALNITYHPAAAPAGDALSQRLSQRHLSLPLCYGYDEIARNLSTLAVALGMEAPDPAPRIAACEAALSAALSVIGNAPIALDYTATMRPLGLARLLLSHGFHVQRIYLDSITPEEKGDFDWLRTNAPSLLFYATVQVKLRVLPRRTAEKTLAIGQKAAYFTGTDYFVNIVEGGGMYGFDGICRMAQQMQSAFLHAKNAKNLIQLKGLGCGCCV
ncbi:MAG: nitrogenase component 1 [Ruthenibacterium sp.]